MRPEDRIVITGIGLTAPNGNSLKEFRKSLLEGRSGVTHFETRFMGAVLAGVCDFDELKYQKKKSLSDAALVRDRLRSIAHRKRWRIPVWSSTKSTRRVSAFISAPPSTATWRRRTKSTPSANTITTPKYWSHHHNPRTVANNPAGEVTLNMGITGPHYAIGAACAAGNLGIIQGAQMLRLGEVDLASGRWCFGKHSHLRHLRQFQERRCVG